MCVDCSGLTLGTNKACAHPVPRASGMKQLVRGVVWKSHKTVVIQTLTKQEDENTGYAKGDKINLFKKGKLCYERPRVIL